MSGFPGYTLTTPDRIRFLDSDENLIEDVDYDPSTWGGDGVALERKSTDAPANDINNWGQSLDELFGSPGEDNSVEPDDGPQLLAANFVDAETVRVNFSGSLDFDAISASNFSINRNNGVDDTQVVDGSNIDLLLDRDMNSGTTYTVTVNNIQDIFGNELSGAQTSFTYYFIEEAEPGDVLISEFMYNEPDGYSEYIELYNNSNKVFDLSGWQQANDTGSRNIITEESVFLTPGSYIVLFRNLNILDFISDIPYINAGSNLSALKNGGDEIVITNENNVTLDSLRYNSGWGGSGVSLERRDLNATSTNQNNWAESLSPLLGTPGSANSVDVDQEAPELLGADFVDERTVLVEITGAVDRDRTTRSNFSINNGRSVSSIDYTPDGNVLLNLDGAMVSGREYTVSVSDLRDIFDNVLRSAQSSFTYYDIQIAEPGDVLISEFMYNEPDGYSEYIELYNSSNKVFDLRGWQQANDTGSRNIITEESVFLTPGSYIVLFRNLNILDFISDIPYINAGSNLSALKNGGDEIVITNENNVTLDSLRYNSGWGGSGVSLERRDLNATSTNQNNWAESLSPLLGTPGSANSVDVDQEAPELLGADFVDERTVLVEITGAVDRDRTTRSNFSINNGRSVSSIDYTPDGNVLLNLDGAMISGREYTVSVSDLQDIFDNVLSSAQSRFIYYDIQIAEPGDVVINEFMYDEPEDYTRYIELYNRSNKAVNLAGWQQANDTGTRRSLTAERIILPPNSYIVLLPNFNLLSVFPDIPVLNAGSGLSALKNGGDNIVIANAENVIIDSLTYLPQWGGDGVALERRRADRSPLFSENWADSPNEKFGTPSRENDVERNFDLLVTNIVAVSPDEVHVTFNTEISESSAVRNNFITDGVRPESVSLEDGIIAVLRFGNPLPIGARTLSINNVQTRGGFSIADNTELGFTVFNASEPGDVLVNEFMYRPPDDYPRYVELINRSEKLLNLKNWRLQRRQTSGDSGRFISEADLALSPGEFLVITDDLDQFEDTYGDRNAVEMSSFPNFTLTVEDQIRLFTEQDIRADSLAYNPSAWGGNGVALERISLDVASELQANWAESISPDFGTPGLPNEAQPDSDSPQIVRASQFEDLGFRLVFNEQLDSESAMNTSNYTIEPPLGLSMVGFDRDEVILFVAGELENDQVYEISVRGVTDIFGNEIEPVTISIRYLDLGEAAPGDIVINEILYRRLRAGSPEFIEIFNVTEQNVDLSGWTLSDDSGDATIPNGVAIRENDYLVFTDNESFARGSEKIIYISSFHSLNDNGDAAVLRNKDSAVIDSLFYQPNWAPVNVGISIERKDPFAISTDPANWAASSDESGATPASENSRFERDTEGPELTFANSFHPDSLEVLFNEFINLIPNEDPVEMAVSTIQKSSARFENINTRFLINGSQAEILEYNPQQGNRVVLSGSSVVRGEGVTISVEQAADFQGNESSGLSLEVSQPLQPGDLVINEIMFDPISDNRDGQPDQSDYVEIHNPNSYAISLEGIFLHDEPDENGDVSRFDPLTTLARWIPAGGYALFYPEPDRVPFEESRTAIFFNVSSEFSPFALQTERTTLSLPISGRQIYLADSTQATIDMVDYREEWHNPNIIDTKGIALERINPNFESNDPANWGSNASLEGGSPVSENTIYQTSDPLLAETGVSLSPNPFSPDGDGFDDALLINYKLDEPDYLLKVRIFDRYGRLVKKLGEGISAGFEGSMLWDGTTDNGQTNRIGIYIVLIEAYNSTSGSNRTFKETAVIARQF